MTLKGVDYSSGRMSAATAKKNSLSFLCRYVSSPGAAKNLTQAEITDWQANGIDIVVVFEQGANNPLGGAAQGKKDATTAQAQLAKLGIPDAPVYFAVDIDATPAQMTAIDDYLKAACAVVGMKRMGVYGGIAVVGHALDTGLVTYAWQTYAWSHGKLDARAHLYQYSNDQKVGGLDVDLDRTVVSDTDFGQVPRPATGTSGGSTSSADTTGTSDTSDTSDTDVASTDTSDTDVASTDTSDTDVASTDTSDPASTDTSDTDVASTDTSDTSGTSDATDTDVASTDTSDSTDSTDSTDPASTDTSDTDVASTDTSDTSDAGADAGTLTPA